MKKSTAMVYLLSSLSASLSHADQILTESAEETRAAFLDPFSTPTEQKTSKIVHAKKHSKFDASQNVVVVSKATSKRTAFTVKTEAEVKAEAEAKSKMTVKLKSKVAFALDAKAKLDKNSKMDVENLRVETKTKELSKAVVKKTAADAPKEVVKSATVGGFSQLGAASWYGGQFHGRKTASGAIYDMYKMTAAHKTLPLNTHLRVTNTRNNRSVMVLVNDRGPYIGGRILDLSYAAAKALGISGVGHVKIEKIR